MMHIILIYLLIITILLSNVSQGTIINSKYRYVLIISHCLRLPAMPNLILFL
jgi:hypothetical protein